MKDEMPYFSGDEEEPMWIESRKESDSSRVDASEGELIFCSEESEALSLKMSFKLRFLEGRRAGRGPIPLILWQVEIG